MLWLWNFFLNRRQFSYVLLVTLLIAGTYALLKIPKENNPSITIPEGIVVTTLPGASAADMETLVTNKLEDQISGINNVDTITSSSGDGVSQITVQFFASADINQSIQDLRDAVAKAESDLPADASTPSVIKINFSDQPILVASISGDLPPMQFSTLATSVSDELKSIVGVSEVDITGVPPREVDVVVSKESLQQYGLRLSDVIGAIAAANAALPAGNISVDGVNYDVNFKGGIADPAEIQNIAVGVKNGAPIYLRDIAFVSDGLAPESTYSRVSLGGAPSRQAVSFTIYKQSSASIVGVADAVRAKLTAMQDTTLQGLDVFIPPSTDQGVQVKRQLGDLTETGLITVALVMMVLLITIGWRESLVAALSIPMSFLIAFLALYLTGNTLNFISLFALILAVGILVDSGIVVTEAIHARKQIHGDPMKAAHAALADYAWPLIAGTMATVAVFAPLFFISGLVGQFIAGIPYTLIFVLMASIFVALGIVPLIAILFSKTHDNRFEALQDRYTLRITEWYKRMLRRVLESRRTQKIFIRILVVLFILSLTLPFTGLVQTVFFPSSDIDYVFINIEKPQGTTLERTDLTVREVEEILYADPDIESFQTTVGQSSALQSFSGASSGANIANITINLPTSRTKTSLEITEDLRRRLAPVTDANVQVLQESGGPPSSAPIVIQFKGDDLDQLIEAADAGKQLLSTIPHVVNITSSTKNNGIKFDLSIDRAKTAAVGLTTREVAQTLRAAVNGTKATSIPEPTQDIDVVVKLNLNAAYTDPSDTNRTTIDSIKNLSLPTPKGSVLLGSLVEDSLAQNNASITHKDKTRIETVSAYPDNKTTATAAVAAFQSRVGELNLPVGVTVSYGGESEDVNQSFTDMFIALIAGLVLMFMILVIAFNSVRYTLYLLVIVPLSLIGVLDGLALTGQPISLTSLLGVITLGGVIVNHAIILMDSMIHRLKAEPTRPLIDVVIDSAATRLRPIVLTTIATVIGMIPLSLSNAMWGPLAFAVMFGLSFAIVLTLILVPILFFRAPHPKTDTNTP
ncbi:efflux RND transporter permease subunit [Candidatus Kaiserbacteria bacterium]|nr:efflux RND transporter permease subunit [Candidatus Kaiserbacteria bacterium]